MKTGYDPWDLERDFPWPAPGSRTLTEEEIASLKIRLTSVTKGQTISSTPTPQRIARKPRRR
jgi:hypothetical protein